MKRFKKYLQQKKDWKAEFQILQLSTGENYKMPKRLNHGIIIAPDHTLERITQYILKKGFTTFPGNETFFTCRRIYPLRSMRNENVIIVWRDGSFQFTSVDISKNISGMLGETINANRFNFKKKADHIIKQFA